MHYLPSSPPPPPPPPPPQHPPAPPSRITPCSRMDPPQYIMFIHLLVIIYLPSGNVRWEPLPGTGQSRGTLDVLVEVDELRTTPLPRVLPGVSS